jgi:hypothetical protein
MSARAVRVALAVLAGWVTSACHNPLGRQYEYEEQLYLNVDGSGTVIVDGSFPAFVALHGLAVDSAPHALTDRNDVRRAFEHAGCRVTSVGQPWRRNGRRFIQVRLQTDDVRTLGTCTLLAWSTYAFDRSDAGIHYHQHVGASTGGSPGTVNWDGGELVAFKLHLPSRVVFHNVKRLDDGQTGDLERGNILTWEQRLTDRRAGTPIEMDVRMEGQSILYRALWLFAGAFLAAVGALAALIWWTMRRGRRLRQS